MKKYKSIDCMNKGISQILGVMLSVVIIITACGSSSSEVKTPLPAGPLQSFVIQCGESFHQGAIDPDNPVIYFSGILSSSDITGVSYQLTEGSTISPDPKEITVWEKTQEFTVRKKNGLKTVYTVNLPDLVEEQEEIQQVVIGYLPASDWEINARFNDIRWEYMTHVNISFLHAKADGTVDDRTVPAHIIRQIREKAREHGVKVLISVNKNGSGEFKEAISNETTRNALAKNIVAFTKEHQLDGFDIDYEDYENWDKDALLAFAKALHQAKEKEMLMTCAVIWFHSYTGEWHHYFDYINIMSYDRVQGKANSTPGQHASYDFFVSNLTHWETVENAPKSKLVGGLPFYGYSWDSDMKKDKSGGVRYNAIINFFAEKGFPEENVADSDIMSKTYYNGRPTIRKKCRYVKENGYGGVMIWQILQDAYQEDLRLIHVIGEEMISNN